VIATTGVVMSGTRCGIVGLIWSLWDFVEERIVARMEVLERMIIAKLLEVRCGRADCWISGSGFCW
jgi:hypothetical protein